MDPRLRTIFLLLGGLIAVIAGVLFVVLIPRLGLWQAIAMIGLLLLLVIGLIALNAFEWGVLDRGSGDDGDEQGPTG